MIKRLIISLIILSTITAEGATDLKGSLYSFYLNLCIKNDLASREQGSQKKLIAIVKDNEICNSNYERVTSGYTGQLTKHQSDFALFKDKNRDLIPCFLIDSVQFISYGQQKYVLLHQSDASPPLI